MVVMDKECRICHAMFPLENFSKRPTRKDPENRRNECLGCRNRKNNAYYHAHPEKQRESSERWRRKMTGQETNADKMRRWMRKHYEAVEKHRRKNPEYAKRARAWDHARTLRRYGLTEEQFQEMLARQQNRCALCLLEFDEARGRRAIDHCHETKAVRGILCGGCNMALHKLERDLTWAAKAIAYLTQGKRLTA
jgi:Recombination endonuclease VII